MRKFFFASAIFVFCFSHLLGQDPPRFANYIIVFQQGFVLESLSGYGFSGATYAPIFNIGSSNPASLANFNQLSVGFSHQANTKIEFFGFDNVTFQRVNNLIPQSAGMVYPYQSFRIGAGFAQKYSSEIRFEDILVTDPQNPAGTGEYTTATSKKTIYSISALGSYRLNNLLSDADHLSFGIQMNMNLLRNRESISDLTSKLNEEAVNWKFGLCYTYHHQSIERLQFGIAYESKISFSGFSDPSPVLPPGAVRNPAILTYPGKLKFGFLIESTFIFGVYNDFSYNFWEDMYPLNKNRLDISGGIVIRASDRLSASAGYYLLESYATDTDGNTINSNDAVYISGGVIFTYKLIDFHLVVADSHLFSGERSKQTIGKVGFGINL